MSWQKQEGAMMDEGFMAEARAETMKQERERRCVQHCSMRPASIVWWRNGQIVKNSSQSRKKSGFSLTGRGRKRSIEWSGVRKQTGIDV